MRSKISLTKELRMAIALFEIPVSGWTCLRILRMDLLEDLVDVGRVCLLSDLPSCLVGDASIRVDLLEDIVDLWTCLRTLYM